jgi:hypothetical protein
VKIWKFFGTEKFSEVFIRKKEISKIFPNFFLVKKREKLSPKEKRKKKTNIDKVKGPIIFIPLLSHTNSYITMHHHCFFIPCTQKPCTHTSFAQEQLGFL